MEFLDTMKMIKDLTKTPDFITGFDDCLMGSTPYGIPIYNEDKMLIKLLERGIPLKEARTQVEELKDIHEAKIVIDERT